MEDHPVLVHLAGTRPPIALETFRLMAERANARESVEITGASHALPVSQPQAVADFILRAAATI